MLDKTNDLFPLKSFYDFDFEEIRRQGLSEAGNAFYLPFFVNIDEKAFRYR